MRLVLPSFAKINWTLEILGRRADGYHELRTLLQTVDLADTLTFTTLDHGIEVACDHPDVPLDQRNLVWRAAALLNEYAATNHGVRIEILKRIPTAGGLGGGSSNAAVTLLALRLLWQIDIPVRQLMALASRLGADVPFFLFGGTCLGVGRGDEIYPISLPGPTADGLDAPFLLLLNRGILVPTREVYAALPAELTNPPGVANMPLCLEVVHAAMSGSAETSIGQLLHNDLEIPVLPRYPQLSEVRTLLRDLGATGSLLSGSGSTVFAVFDNDTARQEAARLLRADGWQAFPVAALGRNRYQQMLGQAALFPTP